MNIYTYVSSIGSVTPNHGFSLTCYRVYPLFFLYSVPTGTCFLSCFSPKTTCNTGPARRRQIPGNPRPQPRRRARHLTYAPLNICLHFVFHVFMLSLCDTRSCSERRWTPTSPKWDFLLLVTRLLLPPLHAYVVFSRYMSFLVFTLSNNNNNNKNSVDRCRHFQTCFSYADR